MNIFQQFVRWLRYTNCQHRFDYKDLKGRTTPDGNVTWTCWKCGHVFVESCGLDILRHGKVEDKPVDAQPPPPAQP